eukprot:TRINITY_DN13733_c0_g1_i1.p1 TRINITY_DN13733_c0_g1~~TRINITY_DN13733_c0_g1_i1.p1  ORF type:complete len:145 (+),score=47.49 TRINITY_DN13733_c0_g1_i1:11-445(+)
MLNSSDSIEPDGIDLLVEGFVSSAKPSLEHISQRLLEVQNNQSSLITTLQKERDQLTNIQIQNIIETFGKVPVYEARVQKVLREMYSLSSRMDKLKKQSDKLLIKKQRDDHAELLRLQKEQEKEKKLLAVPVNKVGPEVSRAQQ